MAQNTVPLIAVSATALQQNQVSIRVDTTSLAAGDYLSFSSTNITDNGPEKLDGPNVFVTKNQNWELIPVSGTPTNHANKIYQYGCYSVAMNGKTGKPASNAPKELLQPIQIYYT
jgi:hypothetical protein